MFAVSWWDLVVACRCLPLKLKLHIGGALAPRACVSERSSQTVEFLLSKSCKARQNVVCACVKLDVCHSQRGCTGGGSKVGFTAKHRKFKPLSSRNFLLRARYCASRFPVRASSASNPPCRPFPKLSSAMKRSLGGPDDGHGVPRDRIPAGWFGSPARLPNFLG